MTDSTSRAVAPRGPVVSALIVIGFIALTVFVFRAMVFDGREPLAADTASAEAHKAWAERNMAETGHVPLWYPDIFLGMPSYGSFIFTPGSPLSWAHRTFDMNRGSRYCLWFAIGAIALFALFRGRGASRPAALAGTAAYLFTPYMLGNLGAGHSSKMMALMFLPLVFWGLEFLLARGGALGIGVAAIAIALQFWANHPQIIYYSWMIAGPYVVVRLWREGSGVRGRRAAELAAALVLAGLMVTLPYVPVAHYIGESIRGAPSVLPEAGGGGALPWAYATNWSFHPRELISLVFPSYYGLQTATYFGWMPFTQSTHALGIVPLVLAALGMALLTGWRRWFVTVSVVVVLSIGFGRHASAVYRTLYDVLPLFDRFRVPSMIYGLLPFLALWPMMRAADWLGSRRADADVEPPSDDAVATDRRADRVLVGLAIVFALTALAGLLGGLSGAEPGAGYTKPGESLALVPPEILEARRDMRYSDLLVTSLLALGVLGLGWLRRRGTVPVAAFWGGLFVLLAVDLVRLDRQFYAPMAPARIQETIGLPPDVERILRAEPEPRRVLVFDLFVGESSAELKLHKGNEYGQIDVQTVGGYHVAGLRRFRDFVDVGAWNNHSLWPMFDVSHVIIHVPGVRLHPEDRQSLAEQMGLPLITTSPSPVGDILVLEYDGPSQRAWVVPTAEVIEDPLAMFDRLAEPDFDPTSTVLLESPHPLPAGAGAPSDSTAWHATARLTHYADERVDVRTSGDGGYLVLADAYYTDWRATLDGEPVPIVPADYVARAVAVPPGEHDVVFEFHDASQVLASRLSNGGRLLALGSIAFGLVGWWRRRSS